MTTDDQTIRLDLWLKITRIVKTRSEGVKLCDGGKVKVNGHTAKPSKLVHIGADISVFHRGRRRQITVLGIAHRSVSKDIAYTLYDEAPMTPAEQEQAELERMTRTLARQTQSTIGRPTKRDRRLLDKFRGSS